MKITIIFINDTVNCTWSAEKWKDSYNSAEIKLTKINNWLDINVPL